MSAGLALFDLTCTICKGFLNNVIMTNIYLCVDANFAEQWYKHHVQRWYLPEEDMCQLLEKKVWCRKMVIATEKSQRTKNNVTVWHNMILQNIILERKKGHFLITEGQVNLNVLSWEMQESLEKSSRKAHLIGLGEVSWNKSSVTLLCNTSLLSSFALL